MDKQSLSDLLSGNLFRIPDYQRGYAWGEKQLRDFVEDLDALVTDKNVQHHYTGTVVTYNPGESQTYCLEDVPVLDVVDGQQRLTTACLYLSVVIRALVKQRMDEYEQLIPKYLYEGTRCKLTLGSSTDELFHQLLSEGMALKKPVSSHQRRLRHACDFLQRRVDKVLSDPNEGIDYLKAMLKAITGRLVFTSYTIEEECEIGMTFELMNSRGKDLSVLELLKNYMLHWIHRNCLDKPDRDELTERVNRAWRDTYDFIGETGGNEDQCLRVAWTLYCDPQPKNWARYDGFKQPEYLPLRGFTDKSAKDRARQFLRTFVDGLPKVAKQYCAVLSPTENNTRSKRELLWLERIRHTGNIANFLPLLVASRGQSEKGTINENDYIDLLRALECYAYRVFLFEGKRADAGRSTLFRWGHDLFKEQQPNLAKIVADVHGLIRHYAKEESFTDRVANPENWYGSWRRVKYTLFEYEQRLLEHAGKPDDYLGGGGNQGFHH